MQLADCVMALRGVIQIAAARQRGEDPAIAKLLGTAAIEGTFALFTAAPFVRVIVCVCVCVCIRAAPLVRVIVCVCVCVCVCVY